MKVRFLLFVLSVAAFRATSVLVMLILARAMPAADYARFSNHYAVATGAAMFAVVGLQELTNIQGAGAGKSRRILAMFRFEALVVLCAALVAPLVLKNLSPVATVFAAALGIANGYNALRALMLRLELRTGKSIWMGAGSIVASNSILCGVALVSFNELLAFGTAATVAAFWSAADWRATGQAAVPANERRRPELSVPSGRFYAITFFGWLSGYGVSLLLNERFSPFERASYAFGVTLVSAAQLTTIAATMSWTPVYLKLKAQGDHRTAQRLAQRVYTAATLLVLLAGAGVAAGIALAPPTILGSVAAYRNHVSSFLLLFAGYAVAVPRLCALDELYFEGDPNRIASIELRAGLVGTCVWAVCAAKFGAPGLYGGFFARQACYGVFFAQATRFRQPRVIATSVATSVLLSAPFLSRVFS
jgi:hypothetical protein